MKVELRFGYRNQLDSLKVGVFNMGKNISRVLSKTIEVFANVDRKKAVEISESDVDIDKSGRSIEDACLKIISLQNPYASDLRAVHGYLRVASDLERIGDHCSDICEIVSMGNIKGQLGCYQKIVSILKEVGISFDKVRQACFKLDIEAAKEVYLSDDKIDDNFSEIILNVSDNISNGIFNVYMGSDLMFIAKYAERIGDHCVNISKWIVYMSLGFFPTPEFFRGKN